MVNSYEATERLARLKTLVHDAVHAGKKPSQVLLDILKLEKGTRIRGSHEELGLLRREVAKDAAGLYHRNHHVVVEFIAQIDYELDKLPRRMGTMTLEIEGRSRAAVVFDPHSLKRGTG